MSEEKDSPAPEEKEVAEEDSPPVEVEQPKRRFDPERLVRGMAMNGPMGTMRFTSTTCMAIGFSIMLPT